MRVRQPCFLYRGIELVRAPACDAGLSVLPDNVTDWIHQHHPIVGAAIRTIGLSAGGDAGSRYQRQKSDSLCVVDAYHRVGAGNPRAITELPDNLMICGIHFDEAVVVLVGNQNISRRVEVVSLGLSSESSCGQQCERHGQVFKAREIHGNPPEDSAAAPRHEAMDWGLAGHAARWMRDRSSLLGPGEGIVRRVSKGCHDLNTMDSSKDGTKLTAQNFP